MSKFLVGALRDLTPKTQVPALRKSTLVQCEKGKKHSVNVPHGNTGRARLQTNLRHNKLIKASPENE